MSTLDHFHWRYNYTMIHQTSSLGDRTKHGVQETTSSVDLVNYLPWLTWHTATHGRCSNTGIPPTPVPGCYLQYTSRKLRYQDNNGLLLFHINNYTRDLRYNVDNFRDISINIMKTAATNSPKLSVSTGTLTP